MADTGYPRTMARGQQYRPALPDRHATSGDWEVLEVHSVTPPTDQPWHAAVYATADVDDGTVGQLRMRSSAATPSTGTGSWSVDALGRIIRPDGSEMIAGGLNGGVAIGTGAGFGVASDVSIGWAYDGYPGVSATGTGKRYSDVWTTAPQLVNGAEVFPGGTISAAKYWNQGLVDDAANNPLPGQSTPTLPDRAYALTGVRSTAATTFGIPQPADHWHVGIFRVNAHLVNGPNTWNAAPTKTAADTVPEYVTRVQELVALGLVVAIEDHDLTSTGSDPTVPAALVANPSLAMASVPAGPWQDACRFYDALCAAFPGNTHNVWIGLPNEAFAGGRSTAYDDFIITMVRRIRAAGFTGILTLPLGRWAGELGPLSRGDYDSLITTLAGHGVAYNLVWEWHMYGSNYPPGVGAAAVPYTYADADEQLAACRAAGRAVWMSEYGRPTPNVTTISDPESRTTAAVEIMARPTFGQALALKYPHLCATWWSTADNTFVARYALTKGAANKTSENAADPNTTAAPNGGVFPWWKITSEAAADEWLTTGGRAHWDTTHALDALAGSGSVGVSPAVIVDDHARNIRLGFEGVPNQAQLLYVEGRRVSGTGGLRLIGSRPALVSAPPAELITGSAARGTGAGGGGGGGGGTVTATDVRSTFVSDAEATSFTILPTWLSPPAQPGDKVVLIGAGPGPSEVSSWSWTFPGTVLTSAGGGSYNPRVIATVVDYNAAGWTVAASANFRAAAICLTGAVGVAASTPVQAFSPANPASVAHDADAVGLAVNVLNYTTASVLSATTSPGAHTTVLSTPLVPRQIHVAKIARTTAGTYDPGAATTGPGSEESTAFAIVAQPTASATFPGAPTIPTFNTGSAITLGTLSADIAAAVAAQPAGTHFKLIAGTYTNWSNVRPKTGMHFQSPSSGQAILSGTGKTWAFRAIDATGSSDNVTISCTGTGSIKIQDYGAGTTRAEYGAIQAQPTDTSVGSTEFTYGTAQGWYVHGVELSKNGAQGIRVSDYFTLHDVVAYGHTVSNVGGDRGVGGLMYNCTIDAGGLNPASGAYSNGAGAKFTFWNASEGRSQVLPSATLRPKAPIKIVSSDFAATHAGVTGTGNIGLWFDLDCQQIEIYGGSFVGHPWCGIVLEGCNGAYLNGFDIDNSDGYGAANGENFVLGGLTIAESTNVTVEDFGILNSVRALIIRQSNRSADWYNSNNASFVNFAWPTSSGGARYWITADGPLPVPSVSDRANMWSGNITIRNGLFTSCDRVQLSEGTNGGGMSTAGSLPLGTIHFEGNDYSNSTNITNATSGGGFFDRSTTGVNLTAWKAKPYDRDQ